MRSYSYLARPIRSGRDCTGGIIARSKNNTAAARTRNILSPYRGNDDGTPAKFSAGDTDLRVPLRTAYKTSAITTFVLRLSE